MKSQPFFRSNYEDHHSTGPTSRVVRQLSHLEEIHSWTSRFDVGKKSTPYCKPPPRHFDGIWALPNCHQRKWKFDSRVQPSSGSSIGVMDTSTPLLVGRYRHSTPLEMSRPIVPNRTKLSPSRLRPVTLNQRKERDIMTCGDLVDVRRGWQKKRNKSINIVPQQAILALVLGPSSH